MLSPAFSTVSYSILTSSSANSQVPFILSFSPSPSLKYHFSPIKSTLHWTRLREESYTRTLQVSPRPTVKGASSCFNSLKKHALKIDNLLLLLLLRTTHNNHIYCIFTSLVWYVLIKIWLWFSMSYTNYHLVIPNYNNLSIPQLLNLI